jgi:hypothetical protein
MAGLNNLMSDTQQTSTTMPAWYDAAQQNIMNQGNAAIGAAPAFNQTTAQGAVNTLQGANNPFTQAQGSLNTIASGAANPWITDATGNVSPNTNTAMGGLFAAQQKELNQLIPEYSAAAEAGGIGSGNFGSLRGQTAVQKARGDALAKMQASQMQAALTNQATGVNAGTALGNIGTQGINAAMNVGTEQMNAPFRNVSNYANLLGSMQVPTTTTSQVQYSPLSQAGAIANLLQGSGAAGGLGSLLFGSGATGSPGTAGYKAASKGLFGSGGLGNVLGGAGTDIWKYVTGAGGNTGQVPGNYPLEGGGSAVVGSDGTVTITDGAGNVQTFDKGGNPTGSLNVIPETGLPNTGGGGTPDNSGPIPDYNGPAIDYNPTIPGSADFSDPGYSDY